MTTQQFPPDNTTPDVNRKARLYGMGCHLAAGIWVCALGWLVIHQFTDDELSLTGLDTTLLLIGLLAPLGLWLLGEGIHPFVTRQHREVLKFQMAIALNTLLFCLLSFVVFDCRFVCNGIEGCGAHAESSSGFDPVTHPVIGFFTVLTTIRLAHVLIAAWKALAGQSYRYPFIWRFLR